MTQQTCERCGSFFDEPERYYVPLSCRDLTGRCLSCLESSDSSVKRSWSIPFDSTSLTSFGFLSWFVSQFFKFSFIVRYIQLTMVTLFLFVTLTFGTVFLGVVFSRYVIRGDSFLVALAFFFTSTSILIGLSNEGIFALYDFAAKVVLGYRMADLLPVRAKFVWPVRIALIGVVLAIIISIPLTFKLFGLLGLTSINSQIDQLVGLAIGSLYLVVGNLLGSV